MGKQAGPSPEELEFIFECFTRGLSDKEVLDDMQDTEFPVRNSRFIRDRRREFNAARKILEITLKQEIDPALAKAKEEHYAELRALIEELKEAVKTPKIDEMSLNEVGDLSVPFSTHEYESDPLFGCLQEHLPSPTLWENYYLWRSLIPIYFNSCKNMTDKIIEDDRVAEWLEQNPKRKKDVIVGPVLKCISDKAQGEEPELLIPNPDTGEFEPYMLIKDKPGTRKFIERKSRTSFEERIKIESVMYIDPVICSDYLNCQEASKIIELFGDLIDLETEIRESLQEILIRRDYIWHTCELCPKQLK